MADEVTKSSDTSHSSHRSSSRRLGEADDTANDPNVADRTEKNPVSTASAATGEARISVQPKPGQPIDNPTASAATGEHPEPTTKNEPTTVSSGKEEENK
jgi:hypothetical protein